MYIGKLSKLANVSCKTIRLYEQLGLLPTPKRRGNYRVYQEQDVVLIQTIKCAQSLGFKLSELTGFAFPQLDLARLNEVIAQKREFLQKQIEEAKRKVALLDQLQNDLANNTYCDYSDK